MKTYNKILASVASALLLIGCNDFEDLNHDPGAVDEGSVKTAFLLNKSIVGAQQNPNIAERVFILQWKTGARFERGSNVAIGTKADGWNNEYLSNDYGVKWLNNVNMAVKLGEERLKGDRVATYENNSLQMARIWRAYMISELTDCFGPIAPVNKFDEVITYKSVEDIYSFILEELEDAIKKIDINADMTELKAVNADAFFNFDMRKWTKYANSLILRYAMRMSKAAPDKAKSIFEAAAARDLILTLDDMPYVQEADGWDDLTGVMSRSWNAQPISVTMNNMMIGLGGLEFPVPEAIAKDAKVKDACVDFGLRFDKHLPLKTNNPAKGFFLDGLPKYIDPRAPLLFNIPGYDDGVILSSYIGLPERNPRLPDAETGVTDEKSIEIKVNYTWNTWTGGLWGRLSSLTSELRHKTTFPSISHQYRNNTNRRIWFGPWETNFLLAEAATYGWSWNGMKTAKDYYEAGVRSSFEHHGILDKADAYLASEAYNRVGTSVAFDHTAEIKTRDAIYTDGYTNTQQSFTYEYPRNSVYRDGEYNNDVLNKIITQKYLAQFPWLPLEAWCDHRRLGLPFFENQAVEISYSPSDHQVPLNTSNYMECKWEFYQQRFPYPSNLELNSRNSFDEAVKLLGDPTNSNMTPLWWTGRK